MDSRRVAKARAQYPGAGEPPQAKAAPDAAARTRRSRADAVASLVRDRILSGHYAVGEWLPPERELAEQLGCNRSSVREALRELEQLRLVSTLQGAGTRVEPLERASLELVGSLLFRAERPELPWIRDLAGLCELLGPVLLRSALAQPRPGEPLALAALVRRAASRDLDEHAWLGALREIPAGLAAATRNRVLVLLTGSVLRFLSQPGFALARKRLLAERRTLEPALQRLALSIAAGDVEVAVRALDRVCRRAGRAMVDALGG